MLDFLSPEARKVFDEVLEVLPLHATWAWPKSRLLGGIGVTRETFSPWWFA